MDFCLGTPIFWLLGFGLMFGGSGALIGGLDPLTDGNGSWATLIFQTVFCATAATIVSGSMAERTKFSAYCIYSMVISAVIYPISGHWIWGGGWLQQLGFHDFAGSTACLLYTSCPSSRRNSADEASFAACLTRLFFRLEITSIFLSPIDKQKRPGSPERISAFYNAAFAFSTKALNAPSSATAISASILRLSVTPAFFRPFIKQE